MLWLWHRPAAVAAIRPLAWKPPYAAGAALEKVKRQKQKTKNKSKQTNKKKTNKRWSPKEEKLITGWHSKGRLCA